jgi:Flp pilus assembly protein TadB
MRIATLIVGLLIGIPFAVSTVMVNLEAQSANGGSSTPEAAWGFMAAVIWLLACAVVMPWPGAAAVLFAMSALLCLAFYDDYPDLAIWGALAVVMTALSFLGWRGKRKERQTFKLEKARQDERDVRMEQLLRQQVHAQQATAQVPCPSCQRMNPASVRFCGNCGTALVANV